MLDSAVAILSNANVQALVGFSSVFSAIKLNLWVNRSFSAERTSKSPAFISFALNANHERLRHVEENESEYVLF